MTEEKKTGRGGPREGSGRPAGKKRGAIQICPDLETVEDYRSLPLPRKRAAVREFSEAVKRLKKDS
ncbi:MAG: hypothetical protein MJH10_09575 [Epibacterium sp.]|nr:hypothetical protein [Epibacterium sp.]NQX73784.1 hypothetical protein [Epibacterium sp.]